MLRFGLKIFERKSLILTVRTLLIRTIVIIVKGKALASCNQLAFGDECCESCQCESVFV